MEKLFFILVLGVFTYYESLSLQLMSIRGFDVDAPALTYVVVILFGLLLLRKLLFNKRHIPKIGIHKTFNNLYLYIYIVTIFFCLFQPLGSRYYYLEILIPLLMYHSCKFFFFNIKQKYITYAIYLLFGVLLCSYIYSYSQRHLLILGNTNQSLSIMNASYFMLYLTPFVLCQKRQLVKYAGLIVIFLCIMTSFKRGPLVAFVLSLVVYGFSIMKNRKQNVLRYLFILVLFLIPIYYIINSFILNGGDFIVERITSITEDKGTHRLDIYKDTIELILGSNLFSFIFGHGWDSLIRYSNLGFSAHNDFLEAFFDFGLIGFILYVLIYIKLFKTYRLMKKVDLPITGPYLCSIIIFIVSSSISIVILYPYSLSLFLIFWGYAEIEYFKYINQFNQDK